MAKPTPQVHGTRSPSCREGCADVGMLHPPSEILVKGFDDEGAVLIFMAHGEPVLSADSQQVFNEGINVRTFDVLMVRPIPSPHRIAPLCRPEEALADLPGLWMS